MPKAQIRQILRNYGSNTKTTERVRPQQVSCPT